jgi:signal transduction histidine kinase
MPEEPSGRNTGQKVASIIEAKECCAGKFYKSTLDAIPANIALLGTEGEILLVNKAWRRFAEENGTRADMVSEGKNYLQTCYEASGSNSKEAKYFAKGIKMVLSGKKGSYVRQYPCHSPEKKRWFIGNVVPFPDVDCRVMVIHVNITELKQARQALQKATKTLEQQVNQRTKQLAARTRQLQSLSMELIDSEERERRLFAQLLHDDLQQVLASARMHLLSLSEKITNEPALTYVEQLLAESIEKTRALSYELSPPVLYNSDLIAIVHWLSRREYERFGLQVQLEADFPVTVSNAPIKIFIFRALQELLFNVVKHSEVKSAQVTVFYVNDQLIISVSDKGRGFNPHIIESSSSGFGLLSIRERATYTGGSFVVESTPGHGCTSTLTFPLNLIQTNNLE